MPPARPPRSPEWGGVGSDKLIENGSGSDTLVGGFGVSSMTGGAGANVFAVCNRGSYGGVVVDITDMTSTDTLAIFGYDVAQTNAAIASATGNSFTLSDGTIINFQNVTVASVASHIKVG